MRQKLGSLSLSLSLLIFRLYIRRAFEWYMENEGREGDEGGGGKGEKRPLVTASHSQGSLYHTMLLQEFFDYAPARILKIWMILKIKNASYWRTYSWNPAPGDEVLSTTD